MKKEEKRECPACLEQVVPKKKKRYVLTHQCLIVRWAGAWGAYVDEYHCPKCDERM